MRNSIASGPEQVSTWSWSTVTVQDATQGVPATIRSQRSSIGTTRSSWKSRWGWSCMQSRHCTTASCTSSMPSARIAGVGVDAADRVVVDLDLEVLGPAAVAAQPGRAVPVRSLTQRD